MTRVLVLDDTPEILDRLVLRLRKEIPGIGVDSAESLNEAIERVNAARQAGQPYDIAVLDFLLPINKKDNDIGVHKQVRRELIERLGRAAIIFNITRFRLYPEVREFLLEENLQNTDLPRPVVIDETEIGWEDGLMAQIRSIVHSGRIEKQFDLVFGAGRRPQGRPVGRTPSLAVPSLRNDLLAADDLTQDLNLLVRDIELHWNDLNEELKKKIESVFKVEEIEPGTFGLRS
jgi:CheY-like chemotaxis protein